MLVNSTIPLRRGMVDDVFLRRTVGALDSFLPAGASVPGLTFLKGVAASVGSDHASLVIARVVTRGRGLNVVDALSSLALSKTARSQTGLLDHDWSKDPLFRRLRDRFTRRPAAHFVYHTRRLCDKLSGPASARIAMLDGMGVRHELTSLLPLDAKVVSMLTLWRMGTAAEAFGRRECRHLKMLHRIFAPRVLDMRAGTIRNPLPTALRTTFGMILAGHAEKEIAKLTHRNSNTVHDQIRRIFRYFEVTSRSQLMARFIDVDKVMNELANARE